MVVEGDHSRYLHVGKTISFVSLILASCGKSDPSFGQGFVAYQTYGKQGTISR